MRVAIGLGAGASVMVASLAMAAGPGFTYTKVLGYGDPAPGLPGESIGGAYRPGIAADGQTVVVQADLYVAPTEGGSASGGYPMRFSWAGTPGALSLVGGSPNSGVDGCVVGNSGQVAYVATPVNGTAALWAGTANAATRVAGAGEQAAGLPAGMVYGSDLGALRVSGSGNVVFRAELTSGGVSAGSGLWMGSAGNVRAVVYSGMAAPGTGGSFNDINPIASSNAGVMFSAGVGATGAQTVWAGAPDTLSLVARQGDQAAGLPAGVRYEWLDTSDGESGLSNGGRVMFRGSLTGTGVTSSNNQAIWTGMPGSLELVARMGDAVPQISAGTKLSNLLNPAVGGNGTVAYTATLDGEGVISGQNDYALFSYVDGQTHVIARRGDPVPGTSAQFDGFGTLVINGRGEMVFAGYLRGDGPDGMGIFFADALGNLSLIAREFAPISIGGGEVLTPWILDFPDPSAGRVYANSVISDDGKIVFSAMFAEGGDGVVMAQVPEPAGLLLCAAAGAVVLRRKRVR